MTFRLRFSLRTLTVFVTLICAYFAAWEITKSFGVARTKQTIHVTEGRLFHEGNTQIEVWKAGSPMPLIIWRNEIESVHKQFSLEYSSFLQPTRISSCWYVWLFGLTIKLPFESEWRQANQTEPADRRSPQRTQFATEEPG